MSLKKEVKITNNISGISDINQEILPNRRAGVYKPTPLPSDIPELKMFQDKYINS